MDTKNQEMWQELIERKEFHQLTNSEIAFVLGFASKESYIQERAMLLESGSLYQNFEPKPLILPASKKAVVIPLYQALIAVAASFLLGFFFFRSNTETIEIPSDEFVALTDTVYVEKVITDTIVRTETKYVAQSQELRVNQEPNSTQSSPSKHSIMSSQGVFETKLDALTLSNKGTSAANDETMVLVENWSSPN